MTVGQLMEQIILIRSAYIGEGLSDKQIGDIELCEMHQDKKTLIPIDFKIEPACLNKKGSKTNFINLEFKSRKGIVIVKE